jgi:hypothetical protein
VSEQVEISLATRVPIKGLGSGNLVFISIRYLQQEFLDELLEGTVDR